VSFRREYCFHFPRNFRWFPAISPECSGKCIGSGRFRPYIFDLGWFSFCFSPSKPLIKILKRNEIIKNEN
jgi:hypothetical protein